MGRRDIYNFQKTKHAQNGRRRNKAKGLGVEKIKARVKNPVRGGAWVSFSFCKHTALNLQQVKFFSKRQGTLARPLGNNPRRLFLYVSRNGLRPHLERRQSRLTRIIREPCGGEWARVGNWSICRICGETLKPPPPFSSSERSTSKKKCNTVTTFGKRRKSKR